MSEKLVIDGDSTITSRDQIKTENDVVGCFKSFLMSSDRASFEGIQLDRDLHAAWLQRGLRQLPTNFAGLDASRPWFVFWISHALEVLDAYDEQLLAPQVASFLWHCQHPDGGFAGGPCQLAHLAPTYAATTALIIAGSPEAYKAVDREKTYKFLMRMKSPGGGFMMHDEGETDMRGTYCAIAVASMLHMLTDELMEGVPEYVRRCQTYEGGIAGEEGLEAHGGYSYCGLAALCIMGRAHALDLHAFLNWVAHRQMGLEGGFQGRTNKLVDSCYSFWQGAIFPLLHEAFRQKGEDMELPSTHLWFAPNPLQTYVFLACQHHGGGLRDKPGKSADFYHTCYSLSGVAASQYGLDGSVIVVGDKGNLLARTDVFYNVLLEKSQRKCAFFDEAEPPNVNGRPIQGGEGEGVALARKHLLERTGV
mmetsp:Transcript_62178/g.181514  ORF Transcript_62178/g.181514 Transcript_62178/m.181514 type:complete len:421 (+) Transcript_62178:72-1334(+)